MLDYRNLPFISSQSPYFELFRPTGARRPARARPAATSTSRSTAGACSRSTRRGGPPGPIDDALFAADLRPVARAVLGRHRATATATTRSTSPTTAFFIYALGYPSLTLFDHLVHLAELTTLAGVAFVLVLIGTAVFTRVAAPAARVGRALLREIRASFYRKLFLAFVLAADRPGADAGAS